MSVWTGDMETENMVHMLDQKLVNSVKNVLEWLLRYNLRSLCTLYYSKIDDIHDVHIFSLIIDILINIMNM